MLGPQGLEATCTLSLGLVEQYRHVPDVVANRRNFVARAAPFADEVRLEHDDVHGATYYH